jgi:hypothetical protein
MWSHIRAPYGTWQWEALSAAGYELRSRLPGLQDSDRLMLADVLSPEVYQRWAKTWTNPGACIAPSNVNGRGPGAAPSDTAAPSGPSSALWAVSTAL